VAALPADKQAGAVAKKLQELNPGFDGVAVHGILPLGSDFIPCGGAAVA
jgi:hypothetical protein